MASVKIENPSGKDRAMNFKISTKPVTLLLAILLVTPATPVLADDDGGTVDVAHKILFYLPNRVFDLLDVVRLRARVGPGVAVGARVTDAADIYFGSYTSVFAGLPGPRMGPEIPVPAGIETKSGVEASVADATLEGNFGPGYSPTEVGVSLHAILIGADVGIDPVEIADFVIGILNLDLRDDDL
jgi:hypothetical protein